ncbi:MAG: response regulator transcription factor [Dehalococcoidia bacterium]
MLATKVETKVLVVAHQPSFVKRVHSWLEDVGYAVSVAFDGRQGLREFLRHQPGFVILEVLQHRENGLELLQRIREVSQVPVVLLSVKDHTATKVQALRLGADDYLVKPIGRMELLARVEAILRRTQANDTSGPEAIYADGTLTLDFPRHRIYVRGEEVQLTVLEYQLLAALVTRPGQVLTHQQLLHQIWGPEYDGCEYVKWHVSRLRRKIEQDPLNPDLVVTVRGLGYRYEGMRTDSRN